MIKKVTLAALFASSMIVTVPTAATAENQECLLHFGCIFDGTEWYCPDPNAYMLCVDP